MSTSRLGAGSPTDVLGLCVSEAGEASVDKLEQRIVHMYDTLRLPVVRYLMCLGLRQEDADEILQETFLRAYKHLRGAGAEPNIRAWVFRVAHNLAINHHKKRRDHVAVTEADCNDETLSVIDPGPNAEEQFLQKERMRRVSQVLRSLSNQEMQCVHLRAEGFRYREIANILGIGLTTVADSLQRALAKLAGGRDA